MLSALNEVAMLHLQRIEDQEQLKGLPYRPPERLLDDIDEAEARGEPWQVLESRSEDEEEPLWVCVFPEREAADVLYLFGDLYEGHWDAEREVFLAEDGAYDLYGRPVSLSTLEDEDEEEDTEWEEEMARRKGTAAPQEEEDISL